MSNFIVSRWYVKFCWYVKREARLDVLSRTVDNKHNTVCLLFQVNAGPLAYAVAFLAAPKVNQYKRDLVETLKEYFRSDYFL